MNIFAYYYGGYAQDDWRVNSKLTVNYGLRLEHEGGMAEQSNNFTVGFDPNAKNALSSITIPADPVAGTPARTIAGGLMYAGVDGNPTTQGNPPKVKWSPRLGTVYSLDSRTVVRGGYGIYWAPYNYPIPSSSTNNYGQVGYTQNTILPQPSGVPTVSLTDPFPAGIVQPLGNALRTLTGVGTAISYVDQNSTAPRVQQISIDFERQIGSDQAISVSYVGSRGDHLSLGGSADVAVNINQLDPAYLSLGNALNAQVANPFVGNPAFAGTSFFSSPTLPRGQLLRPYPQFQNINARHVLKGKSRYNAAVVEWKKRLTHGLGGSVSYTYSNLKDNQVGEGNFYSAGGTNPLNNYNYIPSYPGCTTTNFAACYNPDADFTTSLLDVPHRVIIAPIVQLPFGSGQKWGSKSSVADWIAGGWTLSAQINLQSGFPLSVQQNDNTGTFSGVQRPNLVPGVPLDTPGDLADRLASANHPTATWINPAAFSTAAPFTFGNAPRTITDLRTPPQYNVDAVFIKGFRLGGAKSAQFKIEMLNLFDPGQHARVERAQHMSATRRTSVKTAGASGVHAHHADDVPLLVLMTDARCTRLARIRNPGQAVRALRVFVFAAIASTAFAAQSAGPILGRISFPTSGSPAAQPSFLRGVLLLHSFEYDEAIAAFHEAERLDAGFAMAYWGEAMCYNQTLWYNQQIGKARAALSRLGQTPAARAAKAPTARERAYLDAVDHLFGDGDKPTRDRAYADRMQAITAAFPADDEAGAFYALALLGTIPEGEQRPDVSLKAGTLASAILKRNAEHPGAAHYALHAYDDGEHASLGLDAARIYAKMAPASSHARHMPSHIFLPLGLWDEAAASDESAFAASVDSAKRRGASSAQYRLPRPVVASVRIPSRGSL